MENSSRAKELILELVLWFRPEQFLSFLTFNRTKTPNLITDAIVGV